MAWCKTVRVRVATAVEGMSEHISACMLQDMTFDNASKLLNMYRQVGGRRLWQ